MKIKPVFYLLSICFFIFLGHKEYKSGMYSDIDEGGKKPAEDTLSLSEHFPNDMGMENDTNVLFIEKLEGSLVDIQKRYNVKVIFSSYRGPHWWIRSPIKLASRTCRIM